MRWTNIYSRADVERGLRFQSRGGDRAVGKGAVFMQDSGRRLKAILIGWPHLLASGRGRGRTDSEFAGVGHGLDLVLSQIGVPQPFSPFFLFFLFLFLFSISFINFTN
jgi:hypothetical protein